MKIPIRGVGQPVPSEPTPKLVAGQQPDRPPVSCSNDAQETGTAGETAPNYEAWVPALLAFYEVDCCFMRAESLSKNWRDMDGYDRRQIRGLIAALSLAPKGQDEC